MIHGFRFTALGCTGHIRIAGVAESQAQHAVADAVRWLRQAEAKLTRFQTDSLIGRLNRGETVAADADLVAVLAAADRAHHLTTGRYNAAALPLWRLWHDPSRKTWPTVSEIVGAQEASRWNEVVISTGSVHITREGMAIDLGGVGKEWCVDRLIERLHTRGCDDVLVELGGDCAARGDQTGRDGWLVLLPGAAAAVTLRNEALATSGIGTRRRMLTGRAVSHLIDACNGQPAPGLVRSVTVLAPDCLTAGIHASDGCLLTEVTPATIAGRSGRHPTWVRASDGTVLADPRLFAQIHPVRVGDGVPEVHAAPCMSQRLSA